MIAKESHSTTDSPRAEVGEIDTSAPFQSVKDAVTLFGEGTFSGERPAIKKIKAHSTERVLAKKTQLNLALKELYRLNDQLKNAETAKAKALVELENAKRMVEDLSQELRIANESKNSAIRATEASKNQVKKIEETKSSARSQDLESAWEQYMNVFTELDAAKQRLRNFFQECDASFEAKLAAFNQVAEAENVAKENMEKVSEISEEISALQESIGQVKLAASQAQQEQAKIFAEKDVQSQSYKTTLEASANKLLALKNEFDPDFAQNLEKQLDVKMNEIGLLVNQMKNAKASDLDAIGNVASELDGAKESLQKVAEEESSLLILVESLKLELEIVKREHSELKEKEAETESIAGCLHAKLCKSKSELEVAIVQESEVRGASEEVISTLHQLSVEAEIARKGAVQMKSKAEKLEKEAEAMRIALEEAKKNLKLALEEAGEAKAAEAGVLDQIKALLERTDAACASTSESDAEITISREEFEALGQKVGESDALAEMEVAAAMAQVQAVKAGENEVLKRLEAMQKEIEDMKAATEEALKKAELAEAAKRAVEGELQRWGEREQKKAAETASRILAGTEMSSKSSPHHFRIQK